MESDDSPAPKRIKREKGISPHKKLSQGAAAKEPHRSSFTNLVKKLAASQEEVAELEQCRTDLTSALQKIIELEACLAESHVFALDVRDFIGKLGKDDDSRPDIFTCRLRTC
ncbi:hypothetical protein MMC25_006117 [Agyrium rufum]|nr:hypothetical protein [Agyrium rufum]